MRTQVVVVTQDGELWHTVRGEQSYLNMDTMTGLHPWTGKVVDAACAADTDGNLHVLVVADEQLWHTVRASNGFWTPINRHGTAFGNVGKAVGGEAASGQSGRFRAVAAYTQGLDLHVLAATDKGLWHTVRKPNGAAPIQKDGLWISDSGVGGEPNMFEMEPKQGDMEGRQFRILESVVSAG